MLRFLRVLPVTRVSVALWAWKHRRELGRWAGFAWRSLTPGGESREDVIAEARLRAALSRDERTRNVPTLIVRVADGTAFLDGRLSPGMHDLVASITEGTKGVRSIECRIVDPGTLRAAPAHVHATRAPVPSRVDVTR